MQSLYASKQIKSLFQKNHNIQEIDYEFNKSFDYGVRCTEKTISEMFNKHKNDMIQIQN